MTRKILALAAAVIAAPALFASAAQACISCEYTPEVVKGSQTSDAPAYRARSYERSYEHSYVERDRAPAKKRVVRSEPVVNKKIDDAEVEKPAPAKKVAVTEDAAPAKTASNENSSISVAAVEPVTELPKAEAKAKSENSSIASAAAAAPAKKAPVVEKTKEASAKPVDCKKFFPSVGLTLTVPCE